MKHVRTHTYATSSQVGRVLLDGPSGGNPPHPQELAASQGWPQGLMLASESESRGRPLYCVCVVGEALHYGSCKIWQGSRAPESRLPHSTISSGRNHNVPHQQRIHHADETQEADEKLGVSCAAGGWQAGRPPCFMTAGSVSMVIASIHGLPISKVAILCRPHGLSNSLICNGLSGSLVETRTRERD